MMTTRRRIEPVLSRTLGGYRPAHTSAADSSVQPFDAPKAATRGFKQRAFERRPYVIPQADLEAAAAHIAQARDESQTSHTGDAPKRKTYLCRGIFVSLFGILAMISFSAGFFGMAVVFMIICGLSTRIGPDIERSKFKHDFKPSDLFEDRKFFTNPVYDYDGRNIHYRG